MKNKPASQPKIRCKDVACPLPGFWTENRADGEVLIKTNARHGGEKHVAEMGLAEMTVELIKRDSRFAQHFQKLLNG